MAEWTKAAVLKTVVAQATVGSNPTPTVSHKRGMIGNLKIGEVQERLNWTVC